MKAKAAFDINWGAKDLPGYNLAFSKAKEVLPDPKLISYGYRGKKEGDWDVGTYPNMDIWYEYHFYVGEGEESYNLGSVDKVYKTYKVIIRNENLEEVYVGRDSYILMLNNKKIINLNSPINVEFKDARDSIVNTELYKCLESVGGKSPKNEPESAVFGNGMSTSIKEIQQLEGVDSPTWKIQMGTSAEFTFFFVSVESGNIEYVKRIIFDSACESIDIGVKTDIEGR